MEYYLALLEYVLWKERPRDGLAPWALISPEGTCKIRPGPLVSKCRANGNSTREMGAGPLTPSPATVSCPGGSAVATLHGELPALKKCFTFSKRQ